MVEINIYEIILQVINFLILLYVLNKFVFSKLQLFLDKRQQEIEDNLKTATQQNQLAQELVSQQNQLLKQAQQQSIKIKEEAELSAKKNSEQIIKETREKAKKILEENQQQINSQLQLVKEELVDHLANISGQIVKKVLYQQVSQTEIDKQIQSEVQKYRQDHVAR